MSEMLMRVAQSQLDRFIERGAARIQGPAFPVGTKLSELPPSYRDDFVKDARAAIEAMRQPTQTMEYAGGIKCEEMMFGGDADYTGVIFKDMGTVWRTMADAALTEPTSAPGTE